MSEVENPAQKAIDEFFDKLRIENQYYSSLLKQPVLLVGEKHLYEAVRELAEKTNGNNGNKAEAGNNSKPQFKPLPTFSMSEIKKF